MQGWKRDSHDDKNGKHSKDSASVRPPNSSLHTFAPIPLRIACANNVCCLSAHVYVHCMQTCLWLSAVCSMSHLKCMWLLASNAASCIVLLGTSLTAQTVRLAMECLTDRHLFRRMMVTTRTSSALTSLTTAKTNQAMGITTTTALRTSTTAAWSTRNAQTNARIRCGHPSIGTLTCMPKQF